MFDEADRKCPTPSKEGMFIARMLRMIAFMNDSFAPRYLRLEMH